jgi:NADH-quinone oxidoreductase subunit M
MQLYSTHLLSVILFTPLVGALLLMFVPRESANLHRGVGNLFGVLGFLVSIPLLRHFPRGSDAYEFIETAQWIPSLGAHYALGVDGISLFLIMLTTLLGMLAIVSAWNSIQQRTKEFYILMLLLQTGMLGVFLSLDLFLFFVFWEATLVPMYFLIAVWGRERRLLASLRFFLYSLAGSVIMLLGILALYFNYAKALPQNGSLTFDIPVLLAAAHNFPDSLKIWLFWAFFFAFAIKVPMFPFHTWLLDAHEEAPTAASVLLAGVMLKMGTYGFLRFSLPLLPADPALRAKIIHVVVVLSIIGILYGAIICIMQKEVKRLLAYSSLSQLGFCTLGIFALTPQALSGSLLQQINLGISTGALFFLVGMLYERRNTQLVSEFGGLATPMPNFAVIYLIITLSAIGMPLLNGFIGESTLLLGIFEANKSWAAWAVLGIVLSAAYFLWLYQRTMLGTVTHEANKWLTDLTPREYIILIPLVALAFWIGLYPKPFFDRVSNPIKKIIQQTNPAFYNQQDSDTAPSEAPYIVSPSETTNSSSSTKSAPKNRPQHDGAH